MPFTKRIVTVLAALLALSAVAPATAYHENGDHSFGDPRFEERLDRTERPVIEGVVERTWIWGPSPYTEALTEPYAEASGGERLVQYFDKSRMEINDPGAEGLWAVTNGLLVVEMVNGSIQLGDNEFDDSHDAADIPIAGDAIGSNSPTYADIARYDLGDQAAAEEGAVIDGQLDEAGISASDSYAEHGVTAAYHVPETGRTVAGPFWEFMNSTETVFEQGEFVEDLLFENPFYATGFPITDAYWTTTPVDGESQDVLWQCFERRCLTYTPDNEEGWEVETSNVGQHYYEWRHGDDDDDGVTEDALIYLLDEDHLPNEIEESLVPIEIQIPQQDTVEGRITATLEELFEHQHDELFNEWTQGDTQVSVDSVTMTDGLATINLTGEIVPVGHVSELRMETQLAHTVMQFDEVDQVVGLLNGGRFVEDLATPTDGVIAVFDVDGEQFRVWVTNEETIDDLYALEAGESDATIPVGPVHHGSGPDEEEPAHNHPWSWHLDPEETEMFEAAIPLCDATPSQVEANVDEWVDDMDHYCPWGAELLEIQDYRS